MFHGINPPMLAWGVGPMRPNRLAKGLEAKLPIIEIDNIGIYWDLTIDT